MANINDFKIVSQQARNYFDFLDTETKTTDTNKERLGFYLFILECITNVKDIDELIEYVIDTEFCSIIYNEKNDDLGIDAVYINEDTKTIQLFNFKYRETFKQKKGQNEKNILDSSKFLMTIDSGNFDNLDERTFSKIKKIHDLFNSNEIWKTELYLVSNDNIGLGIDNRTVESMIDAYDVSVKSIVLDDIVSFLSDRPDNISAKFLIDNDSVLTYEENSLSSSKSYLVKLPVSDLIRITCKSEELRNNFNIEELSVLEQEPLELGVLYDNVRGYLGETKFNKNILDTLDEDPSKFFMYNNGITITAKNIIAKQSNGKTKFNCTIMGFQIVNGGQTLRTIYEFKDRQYDDEKLTTAEILVRIFQTEEDEALTNNIAEYTNSQNAISSVDLKSISNYQIQIEKYLEAKDIRYVRKAGDIGDLDKNFEYRISMERLGQVIYSAIGYPDRATNQKSLLFDRYYDEIFDEESLDLDHVVELIKHYNDIEETYTDGYNQKYLYIVYLMNKLHEADIEKMIDILEDALSTYRGDEDLSDARKLIQKGFKVHLEKLISTE